MRRIYLLLEGEYDCYYLIATYSTESKAKKAYKEITGIDALSLIQKEQR